MGWHRCCSSMQTTWIPARWYEKCSHCCIWVVCIICKHFSIGAVAFSNAHFGAGIGSVFLNSVSCSGREIGILDCPYSTSTSSCSHSDDAGMRCQGMLIHACVQQSTATIFELYLQLIQLETVLMEMFVWWEAPISMRVE